MEENTNSDIDLTEIEQEEIQERAQTLGVSTETLEEHFKRLKSLATKRCEAELATLPLSQEEREAAKTLLLFNIHQDFLQRIDRDGIENVEDIIKDMIIEKGETAKSEVAIGNLIGLGSEGIKNAVKEEKVQSEYIESIMKTIEDNRQIVNDEKQNTSNEVIIPYRDINSILGIDYDSIYNEQSWDKMFDDFNEGFGYTNESTRRASEELSSREDYTQAIDYAKNNIFAIEYYSLIDNQEAYENISTFDREKMYEELYMLWTLTYDYGPDIDESMLEMLKQKAEAAKKILPPEMFDENNILNINNFIDEYARLFEINNPGEEFDLNTIFNVVMSHFSDDRNEIASKDYEDEQFERIAALQEMNISRRAIEYFYSEKSNYSEQDLLATMAMNVPGLMSYLASGRLHYAIVGRHEEYEKDENGRVVMDPKKQGLRSKAAYLLLEIYGREAARDEATGREGIRRFVDEYTDEKVMLAVKDKIMMDVVTTGRADPEFIQKALEVCPSVLKAAISEIVTGKDVLSEHDVPYEIGIENIIFNEEQLRQLREAEPIELANAYRQDSESGIVDFDEINQLIDSCREKGEYGVEADFSERDINSKLDEKGMTQVQRKANDKLRTMQAEFEKLGKPKDFSQILAFVDSYGGIDAINVLRSVDCTIRRTIEEQRALRPFNETINRVSAVMGRLKKLETAVKDRKSNTDTKTLAELDKIALGNPEEFADTIIYIELLAKQTGEMKPEHKKILELVQKQRETYNNILSCRETPERKREMLFEFGKRNPGMLVYLYSDHWQNPERNHLYSQVDVNDLRMIDSVASVLKEGYEIERFITTENLDGVDGKVLLDRASVETLEYTRSRLEKSSRPREKVELGLKRLDEMILESTLGEYANSTNREQNVEALSRLLEGRNIEAIEEVVTRLVCEGEPKGDLEKNGFLETILKYTGNDFSKDLIIALVEKMNNSAGSPSITQTIEYLRTCRERSVLDPEKTDLKKIGAQQAQTQMTQEEPEDMEK